MNRVVVFCLTLLSILVIACAPQDKERKSTPEQKKVKPNIVYILADDLGYGDLSSYGQEKFSTPNVDRLAETGMRFTHHYSGATVCAPSRCALMTGLHTGHTFIRGNKSWEPEGQWPMNEEAYTVAELLKEHGYRTGAFGKWGLGFIGTTGDPNAQGFDQFYGYNCQGLAHNYYPDHLWNNDEKVILEGNRNRGIAQYAPNLIHEEALDFIRDNRDTSFFLFYPSVIPHAELVAPEAYMAKYRGKFLPEHAYKGVDDGERYRLGPYGSQKESHAAFAAMIHILDEQVGEIIDLINALGLDENTVIIFTSDNGPHLEGGADPDYFNSNGPFSGYKRDLYEGGIRVPMIASWRNQIPASSESHHPSAFWDVLPTIAEIIGVEAPQGIDGISFLPTLLAQGEQKKHPYLYWEFHEKGGRQALRKDQWKLVRYDVNKKPSKPLELYDIIQDPGEKKNLASEFPDIIEELYSLMQNARTPNEVFKFAGEE